MNDFLHVSAPLPLTLPVYTIILMRQDMIREANIIDAERIAEIDVQSSRYAYKDILSEEILYKDLTVERRTPVYRTWITEKRFDIYVCEDPANGIITGMMGIGICGEDDKKDAFELHFIYVDPKYIRTGIGSQMLQFFEQKAKERGHRDTVIWVLEENETGRNFYEKHCYRSDGKEKIFRRWNKREIRYVKEIS